jgi:maltose alpha-D-glucosyltransferase / alpha-amylase
MVFSVSQVNTSIRLGNKFVLKLVRLLESGPNPGVEFGRYLTERQPQPFPNAAPFAGWLDYRLTSGERVTIGILNGYVPNDGDGWQFTRKHVQEYFDRVQESQQPKAGVEKTTPTNFYSLNFALENPPELATELIGSYLGFAENIGRRVAQFHRLMGQGHDDPAFAPEPFNDFYRQGLYHGFIGLTSRRLEFIRQHYADMPENTRTFAAKVLEQEEAIVAKLKQLFERRISSQRSRYHGRLHLGHLLLTGSDVVMIDFEGDPLHHLSERRIKRCPLRDVSSLLISLGYAAQTVGRQLLAAGGNEYLTPHSLRVWGRFWYSHASAALLRGYWREAGNAPYMPLRREDQQILLDTYLLEHALIDVRPDINDKPELAGMPFRIILHLLGAEEPQI